MLNFLEPIRIENFTPKEKSIAWVFGQKAYNDIFELGGMTKSDLAEYLEEIGAWTPSDETAYDEDLDYIHNLKIDYFDNFALPSKKNRIKSEIYRRLYKLNEKFVQKNYLYEYTCESVRDEAYGSYLFGNYHNPLLFYRKFLTSKFSEESLRSLYFEQTWRMIWTVCKNPRDIFGLNLNELNDNQIGLLYWSQLYDNIGESTEAPNNQVLKDPIAVDGWIAKQSRKRDSESKQKAIADKSGEIFMMAESKQDAREITSLNSREGLSVIKSRAKDIKEKGDLDERQFSHVKNDIMMQANRMNVGRK